MTAQEELTVGELRRALARGSNEQTIREALAALEAADKADQAHYELHAARSAYVQARSERQRAGEEEAMDGLDREQQRSGRPWSSAEDRAKARRQAGLEQRDRFELDEPLLQFEAWVEAGSPERYQAKTPPPAGRPASTSSHAKECEHDVRDPKPSLL